MTGVKGQDILGKGNYEYALPVYGERRPILIDYVFKEKEDYRAKYANPTNPQEASSQRAPARGFSWPSSSRNGSHLLSVLN
jgi:hypothetical protein